LRSARALPTRSAEGFWNDLSPETAFLARIVIQHYKAADDEARLDALLPVATELAFRIETAWHALKTAEGADEKLQREFVLQQLLELSLLLDFTDEMGRRRMMDGFVGARPWLHLKQQPDARADNNDANPAGIRAMVSDELLPLSSLPPCFDLLKRLITDDSALIQVAVEIVQTLREEAGVVVELSIIEQPDADSDDEADEIEEALRTPTKKAAAPEPPTLDLDKKDVHVRCLTIIRALLERVIATIRENPILRGMVHEVIVPSVRAKEADIRELGIICLGLCSMLDQEMAVESFGLFVNQALTTEGDLQEAVYKIIFDLLMLYGIEFLGEKGHGVRI
jgi:condensin complex subunit 3